jgi:hypothetical protein
MKLHSTESANIHCQAFKEIVDLATLFPGLRVIFLQTKVLDNVTLLDTISALWDRSTGPPDIFLQTKVLDNVTLLDTISALWDRSTGPPDKEWTFWQILAVTGLADTAILAITEKSLLPDLVACNNEGLSVIEQLLVEHDW